MPDSVIQPSFSAGEVAPQYQGRVDMDKYHAGLALMKNWFVDTRGGASTREGTLFLGRAAISEFNVVLIPFQFSVLQTYALEFGHHYIRFYTQGEQLVETAKTITGITQATQALVIAPGHGYVNGNEVSIGGVVGMTQVNGRNFLISGATTNSFILQDLNGTPVDSTTYNAYGGSGTVARVYQISTPYDQIDLPLLKYTQSADTLTLTHQKYPPADLTRSGSTTWTLTPITFASSIGAPSRPTCVASIDGDGTEYNYVVTVISAADGEESLPSLEGEVLNSKTMSLVVGAFITVTWPAVAGALQYNVYRQREVPSSTDSPGALFGYIGTTTTTSFVDCDLEPNFAIVPPYAANPFIGAGNYPGCATYIQQRKCFAGSINSPQNFWMTRPGNFKNMNLSLVSQPSDAISATLAAQQVNAIQYLVQMSSLIALTTSGAFQITGNDQNADITPTSIRAVALAYSGCNAQVVPQTINYDVLYVPYLGAAVYDLTYNYILQSFNGEDISVLSSHLFYNHNILNWSWEEQPLKRLWTVRDDGILLCLTYFKSQNLYGWSQHQTQGYFNSVCTIPENGVNATYAVVTRFVPGYGYAKYIERFAKRTLDGDIGLAHCVDAGLKYPYMTPPGILNVKSSLAMSDPNFLQNGDTVTMTTDTYSFPSNCAGWALRFNGGKVIITQWVTANNVIGTVVFPLQTSLPSPVDAWSIVAPTSKVSGLDHLDGLEVTGLADGSLIPLTTVVNGSITLPNPATDIVIGLPYICQIQTLPLDIGEPTVQGKRKRLLAVTMRVVNSRGLAAGSDFNSLTQVKEMTRSNSLGMAVPLITGDQRLNFKSQWDERGQLCVQQSYPFPSTITALIPEIEIGDNSSSLPGNR